MNLRSSLACTSSDIARWGLRSVLKRQGGVLPGRIAMKINPYLLSDLASLVDRSVVITGTNGKTTTSNLIADAVAASGATVVCNRAGNNIRFSSPITLNVFGLTNVFPLSLSCCG